MSKNTGEACNLRAFADERFDYYELNEPLGLYQMGFGKSEYLLPKGAIFVHDTGDDVKGSPAQGCLKLCWTPDGGVYGQLCGDTVVFHAAFRSSSLFTKIDSKKIQSLKELISNLSAQLEKAKDELEKLTGK